MLSTEPGTWERWINDSYDSCFNSQGDLNISVGNFCSSLGAFCIHFCLLFLKSFQSISFVILDCDHPYSSSSLWHFIFLATFARLRELIHSLLPLWLTMILCFPGSSFPSEYFSPVYSSYPYFLPSCHFILFPFILLSSFIYLFT